MKKPIGYCGNACFDCGAYLATVHNDEDLRAKTAEKWSQKYKTNIQPKDINCNGCASFHGRMFIYCRVCQIRRCAINAGVSNCGACQYYPCEILKTHFERAPEAKERLDRLHK